MATSKPRTQRSYDHRLREHVRVTGDVNVVAELGVPRSTAAGWLRGEPQRVVTGDVLDMDHARLQAEILNVRQQVRRLGAVIRLLLALVRAVGVHLDQVRLPEGAARARLLRAIGCAERVLSLQGALRVLRLSPSRYHQWRQAERPCGLDDHASCPRSTPTRLTADEVLTIKSMVMSPEYRHVSTGRLAILAQRLGRVFAAPATWYKLVRERGWRRPRMRVHPQRPREGVRATEPDELWHIDTTVIRLIDGSKVYLHAVLDNLSRRILAWRVTEQFEVATTVAILEEAARAAVSVEDLPTLVTDGGVENVNAGVDELVASQLLRRVVALNYVIFSNSMIEAWWRTLKYQWLFLNTLDSCAAVRRLVAFYVASHNSEIPHSAFRGQTPDEVYYGRGHEIPDRLEAARQQARLARMNANREASCQQCRPMAGTFTEVSAAA
jgi:transposase-like protein